VCKKQDVLVPLPAILYWSKKSARAETRTLEDRSYLILSFGFDGKAACSYRGGCLGIY
jgi:hypothetical protein